MSNPDNPLAAALADAEALPQLLLAWKATAPDDTSAYRVERVDLAGTVAEEFRRNAVDAAEVVDTGAAIPYDPEYSLRQGEYFALKRDVWPATDLFDKLDDFLNLDTFNRRKLTKPRLYVVAVQTPHANAFFGKGMSALKVLSRRPGLFAATWDGSSFSALTESVATFSKQFDWVVWDDQLYVLNAVGFHAEFRDNAALRSAVSDHVAAITAGTLKIENSEGLVKRCQANVAMAAKLKRIVDHGLQGYDVALLKKYTEDFKIPVVWEGDTLVYNESFATQWSVLILLDEDRTQGPVTKRKYEASSKRDISAEAS